MDKNPLIVTVMCFEKLEDGNYKLNVHYVAGFDSADAERRILESESKFLTAAARFIHTDGYLESYDRSFVRMYTTRHTNEDSISERDFRTWVNRSIHESSEDGEVFPATYRSF